jgi:enamine deaminase RidA (YjgF/YER057c/UK114 family)
MSHKGHRKSKVVFLNPPNVVNPESTASLVALVGDNLITCSAIGGWDAKTGVVPDGTTKEGRELQINNAYFNTWAIGRYLGANPEDLVWVPLSAKYIEPLPEYFNYRVRADYLTIEAYGGNPDLPADQQNKNRFYGPYPARFWSGVTDLPNHNYFALAPEFWSPQAKNCAKTKDLANVNVASDGHRHFELIYPSGFVLYPIPATLSHGAVLADSGMVFGTGIRGFVKDPPGPNSNTWILAPPNERVEVVFNNIGIKGDWFGASYNQLMKLEIHTTPKPGSEGDLEKTIAELKARFPDGNYPAIVIFDEPDTGPGDSFEIRQWWYFGEGTRYTGKSANHYNKTKPFSSELPYSNAVRGGDFVFTSQFAGVDPVSGELIDDSEEEVRQAYKNMLAAAKKLGAKKRDLYRVEVHTTDLEKYQLVVDVVTRDLFKPGQYPTRVMDQVNKIHFVPEGTQFVVAGMFYAPRD